MAQLKLNLDAKSYVPINLRNSDAAPYKKTPLNINAKTFQPTSLKKESQPFIPKGFHASLGQSQTPLSIQKPPVKKEKKADKKEKDIQDMKPSQFIFTKSLNKSTKILVLVKNQWLL